MATTRVSLEEFLDRAGRHDLHEEYIDGELREKSVGGKGHAAWMMALTAYFHRHRHEWGIRVLPDLHVNTARNDYRIGDVVVVDRGVVLDAAPLREAPIAVFEILSPTDSVTETVARLRDYESIGTACLYILDPADGLFRQYRNGILTSAEEFVWSERGVRFPFAEIMRELD